MEEIEVPEKETPSEATEGHPDPAATNQPLAEMESKIAEMERGLQNKEQEIAQLKGKLATGAAKYRQAMLASTPEVPEELVQGESIEEIEGAMARAKGIVGRIRSQMEAKLASERVPAGAPPRAAPDLSSLSPAEKIAYGLQRAVR